ncbi:unnamed protein product [Rotaria sp. Silwood2]|nr:unnamed protein product [Rotaria sp. Silwood2]CAF4292958.1 unnamed protein product [Rotaria sp. Silwood2]
MIHHLIHAEEVPVFCEVHYILNIVGKWFVIAETLDTVAFNEKLWSYEVEFTGKLIKIDMEHCFNIYPHCLDMYVIEQTNYINVLTHRVKFVDQRTKLILNFNEQRADKHAATVDVSNSTSPLVQPYDELEKNDIPNSFDANENIETNSRASTTDPDSSSNFPLNHDADIHSKAILPDDYEGPNLTIRMEEYIEQNHISKFNPHTKMRRELLSSIFDDVTKSHQLL